MRIARIAKIAKNHRNCFSLQRNRRCAVFQFWQFLAIPAFVAIRARFTLLSDTQ
jgi:hypothetical protein